MQAKATAKSIKKNKKKNINKFKRISNLLGNPNKTVEIQGYSHEQASEVVGGFCTITQLIHVKEQSCIYAKERAQFSQTG